MICKDFEEMAGAYALDAVTPEERRECKEHLAHCANCTRLMQEFRSVVDLLPLSAPQIEPPAVLRERVLTSIQQVAEAEGRSTQQVPSIVGLPRRAAQTSGRTRRRRWLLPLVAAAAILMFVLLSGMTAWNISLQHQIGSLTSENSTLHQQAVAQTYMLQGTAGASTVTGQLTYYPGQDLTVLVVHGLPQLKGEHVYQGWLMQGKQPVSIGVLNVQNGSAVVGFEGNVKGFDQAAVSLEPGPTASPRAPQGQVLAAGLLQHPTRS